MRPDARGVVFDLDDTLYPYRRFALSGFLDVARHLADRTGIDARLVFRTMATASRSVDRGRELQACLDRHGLPAGWLPDLIERVRYHEPRLSLPRVTRRTLSSLRAAGWRVGILTNGLRSIQEAKVSALGLTALVDAIGYASTVGAGGGKPDPDAFAWIAHRLSVGASRTVFVGDNEACDIVGADVAGMVPVRCTAWTGPCEAPTRARVSIDRLTLLPHIVDTLVEEASSHAA